MKKALSVFLALIFMAFAAAVPVGAVGATTKEVDVIFLVDSSGSMKFSDPDMIRLDAIKLFADLCTLGSTKIGFVLFGTDIIYSQEPVAINTEQDRSDLKKQVDGMNRLVGATDIGRAVKFTTEMFASEEYSGNGKFIVFLSDGQTSISSTDVGRTLEASEADLQEGIINARNAGIPIYTIGLNANGEVDEDQLNHISSSTYADKTYMTTSASELSEILSDIYVRHTGAENKSLENYVSDGGYHDTPFPIADSTVIEANLVITHGEKPDDIQLYGVGGEQVLFDGTAADISWNDGYTLVKVYYPAVGNWRLSVKSASGTKVDINYILTRDYRIKLSFLTDKAVGAETKFKIESQLTDPNSAPITDEAVFSALIGRAIFTNTATGEAVEVPLVTGEEDKIFRGEYTLPEEAEYTLQTSIYNSNIDIRSEIVTLPVGETAYIEPEGPWKIILIIAAAVVVVIVIVIAVLNHLKENIRMWSGRLMLSLNVGGMPEPPVAYDFAKRVPGKRKVMLSEVISTLYEGNHSADAIPRSMTAATKISMIGSGDVRISKVGGVEYRGGVTVGKNIIVSNANKVTMRFGGKSGEKVILVIQYLRT